MCFAGGKSIFRTLENFINHEGHEGHEECHDRTGDIYKILLFSFPRFASCVSVAIL